MVEYLTAKRVTATAERRRVEIRCELRSLPPPPATIMFLYIFWDCCSTAIKWEQWRAKMRRRIKQMA